MLVFPHQVGDAHQVVVVVRRQGRQPCFEGLRDGARTTSRASICFAVRDELDVAQGAAVLEEAADGIRQEPGRCEVAIGSLELQPDR